MRQLVKWLLILGVLLGVLVGAMVLAVSWWRQRSLPRYLTAVVSRGRVETVVNSTGTVKPVRVVSVGAFTSGPIAEVKVDFNSPVKKNDLLALIDRRLLAAFVDRDRAALESQKAEKSRVEALLEAGPEQRGPRSQAPSGQQGLSLRHGHGPVSLHQAHL